jgi:hypothetical protein
MLIINICSLVRALTVMKTRLKGAQKGLCSVATRFVYLLQLQICLALFTFVINVYLSEYVSVCLTQTWHQIVTTKIVCATFRCFFFFVALTGHSLLKKKSDALTMRFREILAKIVEVMC